MPTAIGIPTVIFPIMAMVGAWLLSTTWANAQSSQEENLRTCLDGRYPNLCDRSRLTGDQRQQADAAERRANFDVCRTGQYAALCRKNLLTPEQRRTVDTAERDYNRSICLDGRFAALCRRELLSADEQARVAQSERRAAPPVKPTPDRRGAAPAQACHEATILSPSPFLGNHDEVVRLSDGSIWQVQYEYLYLYAYFSPVVICPGSGRLLISGKSLNVRSLSGPDTPRAAPRRQGRTSHLAALQPRTTALLNRESMVPLRGGPVRQYLCYRTAKFGSRHSTPTCTTIAICRQSSSIHLPVAIGCRSKV